ncbi:MAG: ROK family transcriptional regulator, partial [Rubrobacteraceae bacterium]
MMERTGTNLFRVKEYNQSRVLEIIRTLGPVSRRDIADISGLKFQTVSNITNRLRGIGVVVEEPDAVDDGRRRSVKLRVNAEAAYAAGIQLNRASLSVAVTDFAAEVLVRSSYEIAVSEGPSVVVPMICEKVGKAVEDAGIPEGKVLGAGIGVPGPARPETGWMLDPGLAGWSEYPLRQELERLLGMPVRVDNDATAAAVGERWNGIARDVSDFVYVYLGSGVGAGIFVNHQVCRGMGGNGGEIGHISVERNGPLCYCGNRGCLELYVTPQGILREARVAALQTSHLSPEATVPFPEKIEDVLESDETLFQSVVETAGERLGGVLANVVSIVDPELVVLGGPTTGLLGERFKESAVRILRDSAFPRRPLARVEVSAIGADAGPVGAAALVL